MISKRFNQRTMFWQDSQDNTVRFERHEIKQVSLVKGKSKE